MQEWPLLLRNPELHRSTNLQASHQRRLAAHANRGASSPILRLLTLRDATWGLQGVNEGQGEGAVAWMARWF